MGAIFAGRARPASPAAWPFKVWASVRKGFTKATSKEAFSVNKGNAHLRFVVAAALALLSLAALGLWRTAAIASRGESKAEQEARIRRLHSMVRQGVGSEVSMASARAGHEQVGAAVDSLASSIGKRSGR